jgi:8-oxo-dGTP diphosphatase
VSTVFTAKATGSPRAGDDAATARVVKPEELPGLTVAFDHGRMLADWLAQRR